MICEPMGASHNTLMTTNPTYNISRVRRRGRSMTQKRGDRRSLATATMSVTDLAADHLPNVNEPADTSQQEEHYANGCAQATLVCLEGRDVKIDGEQV